MVGFETVKYLDYQKMFFFVTFVFFLYYVVYKTFETADYQQSFFCYICFFLEFGWSFTLAQTYWPTKTIDRVPKSTEQYQIRLKKTISDLNQEVRVRINVKERHLVRFRVRACVRV